MFRQNNSSSFSFTTILITINVFCFILFYILNAVGVISFEQFALNPNNFFHGKYLWTILTSMFMHAGFFHLFVNMVSLFFVGKFLEMLIGKKRFILFYIISGIFASLFFISLSYYFGSGEFLRKLFGSPEIFAVGASGAIFAIAGVLSVLTPNKKVSFIAGPIIAIVVQSIVGNFVSNSAIIGLINFVVTAYIFVCIFAMFSFNSKLYAISIPVNTNFWMLPIIAIIPLFIIGFFFELPIGNTAHLGGLIAGLIYGTYLKNKFPNKIRVLRGYFK